MYLKRNRKTLSTCSNLKLFSHIFISFDAKYISEFSFSQVPDKDACPLVELTFDFFSVPAANANCRQAKVVVSDGLPRRANNHKFCDEVDSLPINSTQLDLHKGFGSVRLSMTGKEGFAVRFRADVCARCTNVADVGNA